MSQKAQHYTGLRWIYPKHSDKDDRCTSALWIPCRRRAIWANGRAVLSLYQRNYLYLCYRCLLLLHKSARVEGHSRVNLNNCKNCMLWPSHTLNKSLPAIVTSKSLILSDSIHLDHNLSTPIGSNRRFCLLITQSTTFKISFYSPGNKQRTDRLKHFYFIWLSSSNTLD